MSCAKGLEISNRWFAPEELLTDRIGSTCGRVAIALPVGTVKPFLFPVLAAVGVVALPVIASIKLYKGHADAKAWYAAWGYSILALAGVAAFMALSATVFQYNLNVSILLFMGAVTVSLTVSLYRAIRGPLPGKASMPDSFVQVEAGAPPPPEQSAQNCLCLPRWS